MRRFTPRLEAVTEAAAPEEPAVAAVELDEFARVTVVRSLEFSAAPTVLGAKSAEAAAALRRLVAAEEGADNDILRLLPAEPPTEPPAEPPTEPPAAVEPTSGRAARPPIASLSRLLNFFGLQSRAAKLSVMEKS